MACFVASAALAAGALVMAPVTAAADEVASFPVTMAAVPLAAAVDVAQSYLKVSTCRTDGFFPKLLTASTVQGQLVTVTAWLDSVAV